MKCLLITSAAVVLISSGCSSPDPLGHYKGPAIDAIHAKMRDVAIERFGTDELIGLGDQETQAAEMVLNQNGGYNLEGRVYPDDESEKVDSIHYRIATDKQNKITNLIIRINNGEPEKLIGDADWQGLN